MIYKGTELIRTIYKGDEMQLAVYKGDTLVHPGGNGAKCSLSYVNKSSLTKANASDLTKYWQDSGNHTHPRYNVFPNERFYQGNSLWTSGPASNGALYFNNSSGSTQTCTVYGSFIITSTTNFTLPVQSCISNQLPAMGGSSDFVSTNHTVVIGDNNIKFTHAHSVLNNFALFPLLWGIVGMSPFTIRDICITVM